jgi:membrane-associated phospholipid phosphatase
MSGLLLDSVPSRRLPAFAGTRAWLFGFGAAMACLLGILWLLVAYRKGAPLAADAGFLAWMVSLRSPFLVGAAKVLDFLGRFYWMAAVTLLAALCAWGMRERRAAVASVALIAGLGVWIELLKWAVARPRPDVALQLVEETSGSFPAGHAATMAAVCLLLFVLGRRYLEAGSGRFVREAVLAVLPVVMGLSRVFLGVHHLTDVLAGWLLGASWFCLCWWWMKGGDSARWRR